MDGLPEKSKRETDLLLGVACLTKRLASVGGLP